jgi:hypothetical protein
MGNRGARSLLLSSSLLPPLDSAWWVQSWGLVGSARRVGRDQPLVITQPASDLVLLRLESGDLVGLGGIVCEGRAVGEGNGKATPAIDVQDRETWLKGLSGCFLKARKRRSLYCWSLATPKPKGEKVSDGLERAGRRAAPKTGEVLLQLRESILLVRLESSLVTPLGVSLDLRGL